MSMGSRQRDIAQTLLIDMNCMRSWLMSVPKLEQHDVIFGAHVTMIHVHVGYMYTTCTASAPSFCTWADCLIDELWIALNELLEIACWLECHCLHHLSLLTNYWVFVAFLTCWIKRAQCESWSRDPDTDQIVDDWVEPEHPLGRVASDDRFPGD